MTYEAGIGSGVRRIEALTGPGAYAHVKHNGRILSDVRQVLRAQPDEEGGQAERLAGNNANWSASSRPEDAPGHGADAGLF
jgi:alanyl-tRNA synthetase